jgi:outer membrane protein OmpA-like peptidoglycan-associated protein
MKDAFASDDPCANISRNWGAVMGTVAGAALGAGIEKVATGRITGKGLALGAVGGALAGGIIGYEMDRRRCEVSKIAKKHDLKVNVSEVYVPLAEADPRPKPSQSEPIVQVKEAKSSQAEPLVSSPEVTSQPTSGQIEQVLQSVESSAQATPDKADPPTLSSAPLAESSPVQSEHGAPSIEATPQAKPSPVERVAQTPVSDSSTKPTENAKKGDKAGLSVSLQDVEGGHFASGSPELLPKAQGYFREIADLYVVEKQVPLSPNASSEQKKEADELKKRRVLLLGHTDDTGSSQFNADLSERRARAVAKVFMIAGVPNAQIFYQGAGETLPIADNRTEEGRAKNRRVEIVDLSNGDTFQRYLNSRKPRVDYYRPVAPKPESTATVAVPREKKVQEPKTRESKAPESATHEATVQEISRKTEQSRKRRRSLQQFLRVSQR